MDNLNVFNLTLGAYNYVYPVGNFHTMVLTWDSGASFLLVPFKAELVYYTKFDIPVKDVTKVKKVVGIGKTIYNFKNNKVYDLYLP